MHVPQLYGLLHTGRGIHTLQCTAVVHHHERQRKKGREKRSNPLLSTYFPAPAPSLSSSPSHPPRSVAETRLRLIVAESMEVDGTLDIMEEIQALVSDQLQVVSYKWLSRNFSVSSNDAKRMLQDFFEKHGSGLEVVYALSGWLKDNPQAYHIRLVPGVKLSEVKQDFKDNCSVQVYSVQACIPKDPAVLWNAEFAQAEELFDQPSTIDNCLRDNRFCRISNSFVKHCIEGKPVTIAPILPKNGFGVPMSSKTNGVLKSTPAALQQEGKMQQQKPILASSAVVASEVKTVTAPPEVNAQSSKSHLDKEKGTAFPASKAKSHNEKALPATGGSLANMWGRASAKSKPSIPAMGSATVVRDAPTAEADISARETLDAVVSDDEGRDISFKREPSGSSGRKRKVVFDFSDEEDSEENVVSLASPEPPNGQPILDSKHDNEQLVLEKKSGKPEEQKEAKPGNKQDKAIENDSLSVKGDSGVASLSKESGLSCSEKTQLHVPKVLANKVIENDTTKANPASTLHKRKKVLKTRTDERGREVTEVVWEGEAEDDGNAVKKTTGDTMSDRPAISIKGATSNATAPSNPVGKAGNKKTAKGGLKDAKQGNILSFFKRI